MHRGQAEPAEPAERTQWGEWAGRAGKAGRARRAGTADRSSTLGRVGGQSRQARAQLGHSGQSTHSGHRGKTKQSGEIFVDIRCRVVLVPILPAPQTSIMPPAAVDRIQFICPFPRCKKGCKTAKGYLAHWSYHHPGVPALAIRPACPSSVDIVP